MTVICKKCGAENRFWKGRCGACDWPLDRGEMTEFDKLREAIENAPRTAPAPFVPLTGGLQTQDCGCPPYQACNSTACPRAAVVTSGVGFPD